MTEETKDRLTDVVAHYGVKGQKHGVRRYQNEDGSLTPEGYRHYGINPRFAGLSSADMRKAVSIKKTQNEYMSLMTEPERKKKESLSGLVSSSLDAFKSANGLANQTFVPGSKEKANKQIEENQKKSDEYAETLKNDPNNVDAVIGKMGSDAAVARANATLGAYDAADKVAKELGNDKTKKKIADGAGDMFTKKEMQEAQANARSVINEKSPEEVKELIDRIKLEREYEELVSPPKKNWVDTGREIVQSATAILTLAAVGAKIWRDVNEGKKAKADKAAHADMDDLYDHICHYRTKGSKNGVRRYQNEDGSLTPEGYRHYGIDPNWGNGSAEDVAYARQRQAQMDKFADRQTAYDIQNRQNRYLQDRANKQVATEQKQINRQAEYEQRQANRQAEYEQKQAQKQAKFDLKMQKSALKAERQDYAARKSIDVEARKIDRTNRRKNIVLGALGIAAVATLAYAGKKHFDNKFANKELARKLEETAFNAKLTERQAENDWQRSRSDTVLAQKYKVDDDKRKAKATAAANEHTLKTEAQKAQIKADETAATRAHELAKDRQKADIEAEQTAATRANELAKNRQTADIDAEKAERAEHERVTDWSRKEVSANRAERERIAQDARTEAAKVSQFERDEKAKDRVGVRALENRKRTDEYNDSRNAQLQAERRELETLRTENAANKEQLDAANAQLESAAAAVSRYEGLQKRYDNLNREAAEYANENERLKSREKGRAVVNNLRNLFTRGRR